MAAAGDDAGASQSLPERRMSIISYFRKGKNLRINHFIPRFFRRRFIAFPAGGTIRGRISGAGPGQIRPAVKLGL